MALTAGSGFFPDGATPAISVVLPVRDGERFLAAALDSVLSQKGVELELVVIDDGSRDGTPAMLAACAARDARVRVVAGEGRGLARALNLGLAAARGRYVARMDADDIALPGRLEAQLSYLERHPEIGVLGTQAWRIDETGRRIGRARVPVGAARVAADLDVSAVLIHPTVMMRRELPARVGGYRPAFDTAEDHDLWLRLRPLAGIDNLSEPLLLYRSHGGQQTVRKAFRQARVSALAIVTSELRAASGGDPFESASAVDGWRSALAAIDAGAVDRVRWLTAAALADNGGSLTRSGARYLEAACRAVARLGSRRMRGRLALAAFRHQLQLLRAHRGAEAARRGLRDFLRWRSHLVAAIFRHLGILWRSRSLRR